MKIEEIQLCYFKDDVRGGSKRIIFKYGSTLGKELRLLAKLDFCGFNRFWRDHSDNREGTMAVRISKNYKTS